MRGTAGRRAINPGRTAGRGTVTSGNIPRTALDDLRGTGLLHHAIDVSWKTYARGTAAPTGARMVSLRTGIGEGRGIGQGIEAKIWVGTGAGKTPHISAKTGATMIEMATAALHPATSHMMPHLPAPASATMTALSRGCSGRACLLWARRRPGEMEVEVDGRVPLGEVTVVVVVVAAAGSTVLSISRGKPPCFT